MMTIVTLLVFAAALAMSIAVFAYTLVPAMPRIVALLSGRTDTDPVPRIVLNDRRIQPRVRLASVSQNQPNPVRRAAA